MTTHVLSGRIVEKEYDDGNALFLSTLDGPLCEHLLDEFQGKRVSVRMWFAGREISEDDAKRYNALLSTGIVDVEFHGVYSETTGFLWMVENAKVGGHDLMEIAYDHRGHFMRMEIDVHEKMTAG